MPTLYRYIWQTSRQLQIRVLVLVGLITPLSIVPLELQRRIVDHAVAKHELGLIGVLGVLYLLVVLLQGGLKYVLNITKGRVLETVTRDIRMRIVGRAGLPIGAAAPAMTPMDEGTSISMLASESEDVGGFASDSIAIPMLQTGTVAWVLGYLAWVEPLGGTAGDHNLRPPGAAGA